MAKKEHSPITVEDVAKIGDILREATRQNTLAQQEIKYCDDRQVDLLHEIELGSANRQTLGKLAKELRDIRKRRRTAKNTTRLVQPLLTWADSQHNQINRLYTVIGDTRKIAKEIQEAEYHYRTEEGRVIGHAEE